MKYFEVNFRIDAPEEHLQTARDILSAMAGEAGFETFEDTADGITGYVQQPLLDRDSLEAILADFPLPHSTVSYTISEAEYRDWNEQWEQQGFEPIVVDPFIIHDGQHLPPQTPDSQLLTPNLNIEIHARQAFGTGTHETTRMMVATLAAMEPKGKRVLDCGTGTGILAIAALKAGAREAVGYDIDEWSTDNARHNAALNAVDSGFKVLLGDVSILNNVEGLFDIILANINRNILLADMPAMNAKLAPGGRLALSGFLAGDVPLLLEKAEGLGLIPVSQREEAGWICLEFEPHNSVQNDAPGAKIGPPGGKILAPVAFIAGGRLKAKKCPDYLQIPDIFSTFAADNSNSRL